MRQRLDCRVGSSVRGIVFIASLVCLDHGTSIQNGQRRKRFAPTYPATLAHTNQAFPWLHFENAALSNNIIMY